MALTVQKMCDVFEKGAERGALFQVTETSYPTGGSAITWTGFENPKFVDGAYAGRPVAWDATNKKLLAYSAAATEVANTTNIGAAVFLVVGT